MTFSQAFDLKADDYVNNYSLLCYLILRMPVTCWKPYLQYKGFPVTPKG